jgi:DNA-binding protein H-NS
MARPVAVRSVVRSFGKLTFEQQKEALELFQAEHELSRSAKRAELEKQLANLGYSVPKKPGRPRSLKRADGLDRQKPKRAAKKNCKKASMKAKYRDGKTGETWSGRGRMASWLKAKQDAGEDIAKYMLN